MVKEVINIDPKILNGTPVFKGTRVPIETLFDHLESGISLNNFLEDFPTVSKRQAVELIEMVGKVASAPNFKYLYETAS